MAIKLVDEPWVHPFRETRNFWPEDQFLRSQGYVLVGRDRGQEATWRHPPDREVFMHTRALALAHEAMAAALAGG